MLLLPDNSQRAKYALTAFYTLLAIQLAVVISNILQLSLLGRIEAGNYTDAEVASNDQRHIFISFVYIGVFIVCIVLFLLWFRRAYNNLHLSQRANTLYTDGWAVGCWFVPFMNLYRPYQIMNEIWTKTQESIPNLLNVKSNQIIGFWWVFWLISNVLSNISARFFSDTSISEIVTSIYVRLVSDAFEIIALVLIILIIKQTSKMETALQISLENEEEKINESDDKLDFIFT